MAKVDVEMYMPRRRAGNGLALWISEFFLSTKINSHDTT